MADEANSVWRKALLDSDKRISDWQKAVEDASDFSSEPIHEPYFEPTELGKHAKPHKVVRLDLVIEAMHQMHAQVVLDVLPNAIHEIVKAVLKQFTASSAAWLFGKLFGQVVKQVTSFLTGVLSFMDTVQSNQDLEIELREACYFVRVDAMQQSLKQTSSQGKVRDVRSRHHTRKHKRKWKGCKSL